MGESIKNFLHGFGNVLNIAPRNDYSKLIPTYTPQEALQKDMEALGKDMHAAMEAVDKEIQ